MLLSNFLLIDPERVESKRPCQQAQDYLNRNLFTLKNLDFSHAEHWAIRPCGYRHLQLSDLVSYNSQSLKHVKVLSRETRWTMNQDWIKILMTWSKRKLISNLTKIVIYNMGCSRINLSQCQHIVLPDCQTAVALTRDNPVVWKMPLRGSCRQDKVLDMFSLIAS